MDALASGLAIDQLADRVSSASVFTGVDATMVVTHGMNRTVLTAGTVTLRLTSFPVRIAHEVRRTLAHRVVRGARNADR